MSAIGLTLRQTFRMLGSHRRLWLPFLVTAALEAVFIALVWLAPHPPFSTLLAPPIRYVFGDRILHYPWHLWFLYHAMTHAQVGASLLLGAFMSGVACAMVRQTHEGKSLSFRDALMGREVRWGTMALLWLVVWAGARAAAQGLVHTIPQGPRLLWSSVAVTVAFQVLLAYAIPAAVFNRSPWWKALLQSLRETARHPLSTLLIVALPTIPVLLWSLMASEARVAGWMARIAPEVAVAFVVCRLALVTAADAVLTVGIAHLWWCHRLPARTGLITSSRDWSIFRPGWRRQKMDQSRSRTPRPIGAVAAILIGFGAISALAVSGCSVSYSGERLFWKAEQVNAPVARAPGQASPEQFAAAIGAFERVVRGAPGTVWAARAQAAIGSLSALQRRYPEAREAYAAVLQNYSQQAELCLQARLAIAKTYELEQQWDEAVAAYEQVADFHPWSQPGLEAPLYVGSLYARQGKSEQATQAYEDAEVRYTRLIPETTTPEMAARVRSYLALAYQRLGQWDRAIEVLEGLAKLDTAAVNRPLILLTLGSIYQAKLSDQKNAASAYTALVNEFPEHPFGKLAKYKLEHLGLSFVANPSSAPASPAASP